MEIRIFHGDGRLCALCDRVIRLTAREEFAEAGSFTLCVPIGEADKFAANRMIVLPDAEDAFVIESVRLDSAAGECVIGGSGVLSFFGRRILTETVTFTGSAEELITDLAAAWGGAVLPAPLSVVNSGDETPVNAAVGHQTLLSAMREIAGAAGLGLRLRFAPEEGGFVFSVRRRRQSGVFLSRSLGNLIRFVRAADYSRYLNRIHVQGNGGHTVRVDAAGLFDDGIDDAAQALREGWENAEDLSMDRYADESAYREALRARGQRILAERRPRTEISVETDSATAAKLRPGDLCPIREADITADALCTAKSLYPKPTVTMRLV